ncbi:hypothetical protein ACTMSW_07915 [Micromonospora sp. BQ11]|uniref:hypothetical protein n=1 Tax=Micromonospora sp. BQ11 TaxID=3452212 RepID=UPI003F8AF4C1
MAVNRDDADLLGQASEADAQEQRQDETVVGPTDTVSHAVPEATEADLAEQGVLAAPSERTEVADAVRGDLGTADALEQNQEIPTPDEDRRD